MILYDVIEVRGRHFEQVRMKVLASERSLRHRDRRMQQAHCANAIDTAIGFDFAGQLLRRRVVTRAAPARRAKLAVKLAPLEG